MQLQGVSRPKAKQVSVLLAKEEAEYYSVQGYKIEEMKPKLKIRRMEKDRFLLSAVVLCVGILVAIIRGRRNMC